MRLVYASPLFNGHVDNIICILKKILTLFKYLQEFVKDLIGKVINVARCFVENFVAVNIAVRVDNLVTQL